MTYELPTYDEAAAIKQIIDDAEHIVIIQADNPDGDSLGSALALEHILGDMGKRISLYCAVDMPGYLRYLNGWDRVSPELPRTFDASIIVDASTMTLLEKLKESGQHHLVASKPCIVLDHHRGITNEVPFATVMLNDWTRSSAGELIYVLSRQMELPLSVAAQECLMTSILGDTQGLANDLASPLTYRIVAEMIEAGVNRPKLEDIRREFSKMPPEIFRYKARLIDRTEMFADGRIAITVVPHEDIIAYSPLYNPAPLIQGDILQTQGISVAVVLKHYNDGRITGAIRCNQGNSIGVGLAEHFGGGGHPYASGFKITGKPVLEDIKQDLVQTAESLLAEIAVQP